MSLKNDHNGDVNAISVHIHLRLRPGEDDDLIKFFNRAGYMCKARAVKAALRMGGLPSDDSFFIAEESGAEDALNDLLI
jgi:hypothetical protein